MNVGDYLIDTLEAWGVTHIFGIPGDSIDPVMDAIRKNERMKFVQVRHEEAGAFMASAHAKLTGHLAACLGTAGPGSVHLLNGLYDAKMDRAPVVAVTGQVQSDLVGTGYFQEVDLKRLFEDVALYNQTVQHPEQAWNVIPTACREAIAGRGVAHLTFPFDIPRMGISKGHPFPAQPHLPPVRPTDENLHEAIQLIEECERPVALVGVGCIDAQDAVQAFAEKLSLPVINTLPAKGVLPDDHPLAMGGLGLLGARPAHKAAEHADLLLLLGTNYPYLRFLPEKVRVIQLDIDRLHIGHRLAPDVALIGDADVTLRLLTERVHGRGASAWVKDLQHDRRAWLDSMAREGSSSDRPIHPQFIAKTISDHADADAIISMDVGNSMVWMARGFNMEKQRFLVSSWLGSMGFGLPAANASALAEPKRQSIAVVGDGGFTMLMGELLTAVKYNLPIKVILLDNGKLAMIKFEQEVMGYPEFGVDLTNPDFAAYARACGIHAQRVEDPGDLADAIHEALRCEGPALVDVLTDPNTPPMPPRITFGEARNYATALFKETFAV